MIHDYPSTEIWQNGGANNVEPSLQDTFFTVSVFLLTNHLTEDASNVMSLVEGRVVSRCSKFHFTDVHQCLGRI